MVRNPDSSFVKESLDPFKHVLEAAGIEFPLRKGAANGLIDDDLRAAAEATIELGAAAGGERSRILKELVRIKESLQQCEREVKSWVQQRCVPEVFNITRKFELTFLSVMMSAVQWEDTALLDDLALGFSITGKEEQCSTPNLVAVEPRVEEELFWTRHREIEASNTEWMDTVHRTLAARGKRAKSDPLLRHRLEEIEATVRKDVGKGHAGPPMSKDELLRKYDPQGRGVVRVVERFVVERAGNRRGCDNCTKSLHNEMYLAANTISPGQVNTIGGVVQVMSDKCDELDIERPEVGTGVDDVEGAYRQMGLRNPASLVVAFFSIEHGEVMYAPMFALPFGARAAVTSFCRVPSLLQSLARRLLAVAVSSYFDDHFLVDVMVAAGSAQQALAAFYAMVGLPFAAAKRKLMALIQTVLGVTVDTSLFVSEGKIVFAPEGAKVTALLNTLRAGRNRGSISPTEASKVFGLCNFVLSSVGGRLGRAACQPLIQRTFRDSSVVWNEALEAMLSILEAILLPIPPPVVLDLRRVWGRHLVAATDASYEKREAGMLALGVVLWDPETRSGWFASQVVPQWILDQLCPDAETYIMQLEMLAVVCLYLTLGSRVQGRRVLHGVDNTGVMRTILTGWASTPDMSRLGTMLTAEVARIDGDQWFYWVASNANIADIPSRPDCRGSSRWGILSDLGLQEVPMILPSVWRWANPAGRSQ